MARRSWCWSRTNATPSVIADSAHCRLGRGAPGVVARRRARPDERDAVGRARQVEQVRALGVVQLQGAGDSVQDGGGGSGDRAALELGVVLHADAGEGRHLSAAQPRDPSVGASDDAGRLGSDLGASRHEELAHVGSVVHDVDGRSLQGREGDPRGHPSTRGVPCRYTPRQGLPAVGERRLSCRHDVSRPSTRHAAFGRLLPPLLLLLTVFGPISMDLYLPAAARTHARAGCRDVDRAADRDRLPGRARARSARRGPAVRPVRPTSGALWSASSPTWSRRCCAR